MNHAHVNTELHAADLSGSSLRGVGGERNQGSARARTHNVRTRRPLSELNRLLISSDARSSLASSKADASSTKIREGCTTPEPGKAGVAAANDSLCTCARSIMDEQCYSFVLWWLSHTPDDNICFLQMHI